MSITAAPTLSWLEVRGFRAFGTEVRRIDLSSQLVVVHAGNSQGKSSLAEALEFLLTGRSSRRDLFGGAKAEYTASLRNAHLPSDADVWVAAGIRDDSHIERVVRRNLVSDFNGATDCASQLMIDGVACESLEGFSLNPGEGAIGAPVLLQHTLRHVLSTEPKQRATYFKALLEMADLDIFRHKIQAQRFRIEKIPSGAALEAIDDLARTQFADAAQALQDITITQDILHEAENVVLEAGNTFLEKNFQNIAALRNGLEENRGQRANSLFPIAQLAVATIPALPSLAPNVERYSAALQDVDRSLATLMPALVALLGIPEYGHLDRTIDCPVCATPSALNPERIVELGHRLKAGELLQQVAAAASSATRRSQGHLNKWLEELKRSLPAALSWDSNQQCNARASFIRLCGENTEPYDHAVAFIEKLKVEFSQIIEDAKAVEDELTAIIEKIERRVESTSELFGQVSNLEKSLQRMVDYIDTDEALNVLRRTIQPALAKQEPRDGIDQILAVIDHLPTLPANMEEAAFKVKTIKRLNAVERLLKKSSSHVLDTRFAKMSDSIERWWLTIRPEEFVNFSGVKRRPTGVLFVNLVAELQPLEGGEGVERDALGVYSDSQLNALGLSTFLARTELIGHPTVFLDDPIPGSDNDHRLTFAQNTISELLHDGRQVILTTHDSKLADWAATLHDAHDPMTYELNLIDFTLGAEPTQTSDAYSRYMLQAEDNLNSPTAAGRRNACTAYRSAAERLAKQIIATNRSASGNLCSVADVEAEAKQLGDLVPLVRGFVLSNDEAGKWSVMPKVLNPGNHDDAVPSTTELKQVRGNLRFIAKAHRKKWGSLRG